MNKEFRIGALGALMDEYERASGDLTRILNGITDSEFELLHNTQLKIRANTEGSTWVGAFQKQSF